MVAVATEHLLAISGLNISLVAGSLYLIGILSGFPQKLAAVTAFIIMIFQVLIAGSGMPVARAGIMAGVGFWATILNREKSSMNAFFLAFLSLLILDTRSLENVSFQLSFLSVFALMIFSGNIFPARPWFQWVSGSLAVLALTFPLTVIYFNSFAPISLLANIGGIPLFDLALLTVLLALASPFPGISFLIGHGAELFLKAAIAWIRFWSLVPWGYFHVPVPAPSKVFFYYGFLSVLILAKTRKWNWGPKWMAALAAGWVVSAALFFWPVKNQDNRWTFFSAGRNEIAALSFNGTRWLVNTGRKGPSRQAEWIVTPYFRAQGVQKLAGVLLTDAGNKHAGGIESMARQFQWDYLLFPGGEKPPFVPSKILSKVKKIGMNPGARITMKGGNEIRILDVVEGKMILEASCLDRRVLFLPAVNRKILQAAMRGKEEGKSDFLILPAFYERHEDLVREIAETFKPAMVIAPFISPALEEFFIENKIEHHSLEKEGSFSVDFGNLRALKA